MAYFNDNSAILSNFAIPFSVQEGFDIMDTASYISVILPLKLEWEPCYEVPHEIYETYGELRQGDRVRVTFAGREYIGAVNEANIEPQTAPDRIKPIIAAEKAMERISAEEIELWKRVAGYYLCTVGEVYKAAYPIGKLKLEEARAAAKRTGTSKGQESGRSKDGGKGTCRRTRITPCS